MVHLNKNNVVLELGLCTQLLASTVEGIAATVLDRPQGYFCRQLVHIFINKLTRSRIMHMVQRRIFTFPKLNSAHHYASCWESPQLSSGT